MTEKKTCSSAPRTLVLGVGSWGITLAALLNEKHIPVTVWDIDHELLDFIALRKTHPRLSQLQLDTVQTTYDPVSAINENELILIVVPSHAFRETCELIKKAQWGKKTFLICTKGIEHGSGRFLSQVLQDVLDEADIKLAVLSGPSHAEEVAQKKPASVTIASENGSLAEKLQEIFFTPYFRTYTNNDVIGVQMGGAVKNVIAIAAGVCDGLELGDNAKAALITRGLMEINRFGKKVGARPLTFMGLAGVGDLVVTTMSKHSRNRTFGEYLGQGLTVREALEKVEMVVEGYYTVRTLAQLAEKWKVDMPIIMAVYRLLFQGTTPKEEVEKLMRREAKEEICE